MNCKGKVALVTGASRGIGRAVALKLSHMGAYVYINYVQNKAAAQETLWKVTDGGGEGRICRFDVSDFNESRTALKNIVDEKGRIDILINNAGISNDGLIVRIKEDDWNRIIDTNLKGVFNCCRATARYMIKQRRGRIVNITSIVAETGNAGQSHYAAAKAGIIGLTKSLAKELGSRNICVNAVAPGFIETDMTASLSDGDRESVRNLIPLERLGTPEDVAGVVAFLVSEEASYITGQIIRVNGGLYM